MVAHDPEELRNRTQNPEQTDGVEEDLSFNQQFDADGQIGAKFDKGDEKIQTPLAKGVHEHEYETINGYTIQTTNPERKAEAIAEGIRKQAEKEREAEQIIKQALNEASSDTAEIDPAVAQINAERDEALAGAQKEYDDGMAQADQEEQLVAQETFSGVQEVMNA